SQNTRPMKPDATPAIVACLIVFLVMGLSSPGVLRAQRDASPSPDAAAQAGPPQPGIRVALPKGKKLVLTDGTFQLVREYSVDGDRVRYWSVERSAWEEIPTNLVNWDATHEGEPNQSKREAERKAKLRASELAERTKDINVDRSFEIKPGLFLPDG